MDYLTAEMLVGCSPRLYPGAFDWNVAVHLTVTSAGQHAAEVSAEAQRRPEEDRGPGAAGDPRPSAFTLLRPIRRNCPPETLSSLEMRTMRGSVVSLTCSVSAAAVQSTKIQDNQLLFSQSASLTIIFTCVYLFFTPCPTGK